MSWSKSFCDGRNLKIDYFNPEILNTFFRAGSIEAWGRGIQRIRDDCKTHGSPDPLLRYEETGLTIEFPFAASYVESMPES